MSSPHMSFRLNHYQLAKALRILVTLEPNQPIPSLSQAAKMIIIDWIAKHSINSTIATSQADIDAIKLINKIPASQINPYTTIQTAMANAKTQSSQQAQQITQKSAQQIQRELEEDRIFEDMKRESLAKIKAEQDQQITQQQDTDIDQQIELASQTSKRISRKPSEFHDPNITDSVISSVTDFSPPADWKE